MNILLAYWLDLALGDPRWLPHPVKFMGSLINHLESRLRSGQKKMLRIKGAILALAIVGLSGLSTYLILVLAKIINPIAESIIWIFLAYTSLATKGLFLHTKEVLKGISEKNIVRARNSLSYIVGRDTQHLSEDGVIRAAIESIAESTNDGIIAPLFYLILGGPVLALCYKAINTLDSMVGYKNEKYNDFGWFSARLDDVANFIPGRITGILIPISSFIIGKGFIRSFKTMLRDGRKHPSPNSGLSEAAMAGALEISLGGPSTYQGKLVPKPYLGKGTASMSPLLINDALKIGFIASLIMVLIGVVLKWVL